MGPPKDFVPRHDGVLVATSTLDREDIMFMAAEEEAHGNLKQARALRVLGERKPLKPHYRVPRRRPE